MKVWLANRAINPEVNTGCSQWQIGNIAETRARCLRDIAIDYKVYSLPGFLARTASHTSQWQVSWRQRGSSCKSRIQLSNMRMICIRLHIARYSCLAKFSKTTSLCVGVFFIDFDQNDMNIPAFWRGCIF